MNKLISLFKTIFILGVIGIFGFYFTKLEYLPYPVKEARLEEVRKEASFLSLNESVILELRDKQEYQNIQSVDGEELGKEELFEEIDKRDYNF